MEKLNVLQIERPWGNFRQFIQNTPSTVKIITVKANESLSLQSHNHRTEFWHIISGSGFIEIADTKKETKIGDEHEIPVGVKHRISAGMDGIQFLEIAIGNFDEEDIIRYEDKYNRI